MGAILNELANLPIDDEVHLYIFVVNGQYREPLYQMMEDNFKAIAKSIGSNAVIAMGTDPKTFTSQVADQYLGEDKNGLSLEQVVPALLITNAQSLSLASR